MHKITNGTVTINGQVYKAFEMYDKGPWKVVRGNTCFDPSVMINIAAKSGRAALKIWLASRPDAAS